MKFPFISKGSVVSLKEWATKFREELKKPSFLLRGPILALLFALFLFPSFLVALSLLRRDQKLRELEQEMSCLEIKILRKLEAQKAERNFFKEYRHFDATYIEQVLSSLTFLEPEVQALKLMRQHPGLVHSEALKERMDALTEGENTMIFVPGEEEEKGGIKEAFFKQHHRVEVSQSDVEKILAIVEGTGECKGAKPQLVIQYFDLDKKRVKGKETCFLDMNIIERGLIK